MKILLRESVTEMEIKKSKFLCHIKPVSSEEEAKDFVSAIKKRHPKATHNVPVYLLGKNYDIQKYSDDGEPSGTAGLPVLRMLISEEVSNVALVITRYFGGVKLGKGGLVRAYVGSAKSGLETSGLSEVLKFCSVTFDLDYSLQSKFLHKLENKFIRYNDRVEYADSIRYSFFLDENEVDSFEEFMVDFTSGAFSFLEKKKVEGVLLDGKIEEVRCLEEF